MIQAIGLTSAPRRNQPLAVADLTFEARPGRITVLLGEPGAGKTSALRLLLRRDPGRGVALFRGRPLDRIQHPAREIGVLLGDVPGHPARTARNHLRMLAAAAGVPLKRVDEVLEVVGLAGLAEQRLGDFSRGMDRRLGMAAALLGDPHTLVLDEPAHELSPRETSWLYGLLRGFAAHGGTVLTTSRAPKEAARIADRVVTIGQGRLLADQSATDFTAARMRPRIVVQSPYAGRLAHLLSQEPPAPDAPPAEVVQDGGSRLFIYGSSCAAVGEAAFRHGILVHRLTEETGDSGPAPGEPPEPPPPAPQGEVHSPLAMPNPVWPLLYEVRRTAGVRTPWLVITATLAASLLTAVPLARFGAPPTGILTAWPARLPLPPAAFGAGLLGALAFGQEFRYPALAPDGGTAGRRLALLGAKIVVTGTAAVLLALVTVALDALAGWLLFGNSAIALPGAPAVALTGWIALNLGCAWAGLSAAGLFRSTVLGLLSVLAVPTLAVPLLGALFARPAARSLIGLPERLRSTVLLQWPAGLDQGLSAALRLLSQPIGWALVLALTGLLGAYVLTVLRGRPR
ncbi:ATP-binding cassette domain-containing protein [Streptomyces orinoci]|uniref:ATP-binding cassette domain-containing protein n=1 Tax=Streptomyces orinoci TaxID=67339 RepID=A0ABV3K2F6_STRON|nr:ATP-binding cassette domain-containing protein [Streptomyces orinoci]